MGKRKEFLFFLKDPVSQRIITKKEEFIQVGGSPYRRERR